MVGVKRFALFLHSQCAFGLSSGLAIRQRAHLTASAAAPMTKLARTYPDALASLLASLKSSGSFQ